MAIINKKLALRNKRHARVRSEISGTAQRPRVAVFKSNKNMYVQIIDDVANKTLVGLGNAKIKPAAVEDIKGTKEKTAYALGQTLADKMKDMGITQAVFDRGGFKYHGRVKAVAEGLRKNGIKI
jgi:large subunit ribosomal protein L18